LKHTLNEDQGKKRYNLKLSHAKTAQPSKHQNMFVVEQVDSDSCPIKALRNSPCIVPAGASDPVFSWQDNCNRIHPLSKTSALKQINSILQASGLGTSFGHGFKIGGALFYLSYGVPAEIVRLDGHIRLHLNHTFGHLNQ
jgi:hypothetical protein